MIKRECLVPEVRPLLIALQQTGFYMTDELYYETLKIANEEIFPKIKD
jgi:predicted nucleic acid-binding protein